MEIRTALKIYSFCNVKQGEVFEYDDCHLGNVILLKTEKVVDEYAGVFNSVRLTTGEFFCVEDTERVKILKAIVEIER